VGPYQYAVVPVRTRGSLWDVDEETTACCCILCCRCHTTSKYVYFKCKRRDSASAMAMDGGVSTLEEDFRPGDVVKGVVGVVDYFVSTEGWMVANATVA